MLAIKPANVWQALGKLIIIKSPLKNLEFTKFHHPARLVPFECRDHGYLRKNGSEISYFWLVAIVSILIKDGFLQVDVFDKNLLLVDVYLIHGYI